MRTHATSCPVVLLYSSISESNFVVPCVKRRSLPEDCARAATVASDAIRISIGKFALEPFTSLALIVKFLRNDHEESYHAVRLSWEAKAMKVEFVFWFRS